MAQNLQQLEMLAEKMYSAPSQEERQQAQNALVGFTNQREYIGQCQYILTNSREQFALMLASSSLLKLCTSFWNSFTNEQMLEMRDFLLRFIAERFETAPDFVLANLIQVACRITKLGWLQNDSLHDVNGQARNISQLSPRHYILALRFLDEMVDSVNQQIKGHSIMTHRKIAVSFREDCLFDIFKLSIGALQKLSTNQFEINDQRTLCKLQHCALMVTLRCLKFDYIGTTADESAEDFGALQIPSSWRPTIEDKSLLSMLFSMTYQPSQEVGPIVMEILVQLASCRRSLFSDSSARKSHLEVICQSTAKIAEDQGNYLVNEATYTQFCRLLLALKANYQLQELVKLEPYGEWIHAVTQFSIASFQNWESTGYSVHYLVTLWARLVMSIAYVGPEFETYLEQYLPQICSAYIDTRIKSVERCVQEESVSEMFDDLALETQLQYIHIICRHSYAEMFSYLQNVVSALTSQYREMISVLRSGQASSLSQDSVLQLQLVEYKIAWMIYAIGAIVSGNSTTGNDREEQLDVDSKLIAVVIDITSLIEARVAQVIASGGPAVPEQCQLAILTFFQQIRKSHIGYDAYAKTMRVLDPNHEPEIYTKLSEFMGRAITQQHMLTLIVQTVLRSLDVWANSPEVIDAALSLLADISTGHSSSKLLIELDCCKQLLTNHGSQYFQFMNVPKNSRYRTKFYVTWGRLALTTKNLEFFDEFMKPFVDSFQALNLAVQGQGSEAEHLSRFIYLCRDLRGVASSIYTGTVYEEFFEWIHPDLFALLTASFSKFMVNPLASVPMLRFLSEFCFNQSNRIDFPPSSPNGIVLFKDVVSVIELYSAHMSSYVLSQKKLISSENKYRAYIKPLSLCMETFLHALVGGYVNFGVFPLYNDDCLQRVFTAVLQFITVVGLDEMRGFPKCLKNYFALVECLFRDHLDLIVMLDTQVVLMLINSLHEGLFDEDPANATHCACAIDHFASVMHVKSKRKRASQTLLRFQEHVSGSVDLFTQMLASLFNLIVFEGVSNMWAFSRPVLSLILLNQNGFEQYRNSLIGFQPADKHERIHEEFVKLMDGIKATLDAKNRDNFTQQLIYFSVAMKKFIVKPPSFA